MKVLLVTEKSFAPDAETQIYKVLCDANLEVAKISKYTSKAQVLEAVADADALIVRSDIIDAEVMAAAPNLKLIVRAGAGYDNIDLDAATSRGIVVMNTPGQNANSVAELAFTLMLLMARNRFSGSAGSELLGKRIGLHAFGAVARAVARIAKGFGMEVYAYDPFLTPEQIEASGVKAVGSVEELYSNCQYVSLHLPSTPATRSSINYSLLSRMPQNATLVNTARKEVIEEADLMQLMNERPDFRYVADVKPSTAADFEAQFPDRVIFTPKKNGAQTAEANANAGIAAANQAVGFLLQGIDRFRVN